ncbi:MAG: hypothetical protein IT385_06670 [Deltaproteobacteria bacterium]|nr:hypothetical protein [Deltaproteobacteria bacterium]
MQDPRPRPTPLALLALTALPLASLAPLGCSGDSGETVLVVTGPDTIAAEPGTSGGACLEGNACTGDTLSCFGGICREPVCNAGDVGCACFANATCSKKNDGSWLVCDSGLCREPSCAQGALGCGCLPGAKCDTGLFCSDASGSPRCEMASCAVGDLGCGCKTDRTCNTTGEGVQLVCDGALCVTPTCAVGADGCSCRPDYSCNAGLACGDDGKCGRADCTRGELGCGCLTNGSCKSGLACGTDNTCQAQDCEQGAEGCGCFADWTCSLPTGGGLLTCQAGTCVKAACTPGSEGCGCTGAGACGEGLACLEGYCVASGCTTGTIGCPCSGGACGADLACVQGICVDAMGTVGGDCYANGTCNPGLRCDDASDSCVTCSLGSTDCTCFSNGTCLSGLACVAGRCLVESGYVAEERHKLDTCYSPCTEGTTLADGTWVPCSSGGFMQHCLTGTECEQGSCVPTGTGPRTCTSDLDCPSFQACMSGQCWSECDYDSQCADGFTCWNHVCRQPCLASQAACPRGNACVTVDGEAGYCMPTPDPVGTPVSTVDGELTVTHVLREFTNTQTRQALTIINNSPRQANVQVRFTRQVHPDTALGTTIVTTTNPLSWMSLGQAADFPSAPDLLAAEAQALAATTVPQGQQTLAFDLGPGQRRIIIIDRAHNALRPLWDGELEVAANGFGSQKVALAYRSLPDGQWNGSIYYFANFRDSQFSTWQANKTKENADATENAFIQAWTQFRNNAITLDQFRALLHATVTGSWNHPSVREVCHRSQLEDPPGTGNDQAACFLYDNANGWVEYTQDITQYAVPSGAVELPFSMNIKPTTAGSLTYQGRINSDVALQYAGLPEVTLRFQTNPASPVCSGGNCLATIAELSANVTVGARYPSDIADQHCKSDPEGAYGLDSVPWYVPGFLRGTEFDPTLAMNFRFECRDRMYPFEGMPEVNANLAGANPIPDGRRRVRHLELIDGMLVDQTEVLLLVREWYETFVGDDASTSGGAPPLSAYAVIRLQRSEQVLGAEDYVGNDVQADQIADFTPGLFGECSPDLVAEVLGHADILTAEEAEIVANALITGVAEPPQANSHLTWDPGSADDTQVHYYCEDTGTFDQGPKNHPAWPIPCPVGSKVTYFTTRGITQQQIDELACQQSVAIEMLPTTLQVSNVNQAIVQAASQEPTFTVLSRGTCRETLNVWAANNRFELGLDPRWQCEDPGQLGKPAASSLLCDAVRLDVDSDYDLRQGKLFYPPSESAVPFIPIEGAIADAFRYRVRFRSASGRPVGFVPTMCRPDSDLEPYCYDPVEIEHIQDRVDCLLHIHDTWFPRPGGGPAIDQVTIDTIRAFLTTNFSYITAPERCVEMGGSPDDCAQLDPLLHYDGFERHFAELAVMLGDDAFTKSLGSRFDLAGTSVANFKGSLLEPDGIDLSGAAGYQMLLLYRATQYYEMVLDRFYDLTPYLWNAGTSRGAFVTAGLVTSYMDRIALASTKLSRVWNEISRRYQRFNRADLARRVIERGYTRAYLESIALTRIMQRIITTVAPSERTGVQSAIDDAQRRYRIAMLDMAEAYGEITNDINYFGFTLDYIPFPGLRPTDVSAVHLLLDRAWTSVQRASQQEEAALSSTRSFDTDTAQFQAELTRVANTYEDQLAEICGTFVGTDGRVYPATAKYIDLFDGVKSKGSLPPVVMDPCGLVSNGQIYDTGLRLEQASLASDALIQSFERTVEEIEAIGAQVNQRCAMTSALASFEFAKANETINLENSIRSAKLGLAIYQRTQNGIIGALNLKSEIISACTDTVSMGLAGSIPNVPKCVGVSALAGVKYAAQTASDVAASAVEGQVNSLEEDISLIQAQMAFTRSQSECQFAKLEATGQIRQQWTRMSELRIQMLQQQYDMEITSSQLNALRNKAQRLKDQQGDAEQVLINVEAAKNDPNVRIYQNAAVIRSDRSFYEAMRDVYRLTRVFEYYTSQTYAQKEKLFLIRMVGHGEDNLEDYLVDLENAFFEFEETFGVPSTRVEVLSLRDDIMLVPRYDDDLSPLSQADRIAILRQRLASSEFIDRRGYIAVPFSTSLEQLSPLTRNHKVLYLEAEVIGSDIGDPVGRVYVQQRGTGTVRGVDNDKLFYAFPEIIGVVNPFFNGQRVFAGEVYRNDRLRDRPFANTHWELVLNQLDESVNKDINLNSLTDVRVYVYYTDFTEL